MESLEPARIAVHLSRSLQKKSTPSAGTPMVKKLRTFGREGYSNADRDSSWKNCWYDLAINKFNNASVIGVDHLLLTFQLFHMDLVEALCGLEMAQMTGF